MNNNEVSVTIAFFVACVALAALGRSCSVNVTEQRVKYMSACTQTHAPLECDAAWDARR